MTKSSVTKSVKRSTALILSGLCVSFLLNGCAPVVVSTLRDAVRAATQNAQSNRATRFGGGTQTNADSFKNSDYAATAAHYRNLPLPTPSQSQISQLQEFQNRATQWASLTVKGAAKPVRSGNGIVVGEPNVATSSTRSTDLANFGAGCARWLHFNMGGQGALGKTPLWGSVADTRDELRKTNCRWTKTDLPQVARGTGATHIAMGTIAGTSVNCTLTYQLWSTQTRQIVGAPLVAKGTFAQIVSQLPQMAQKISTRLASSTRLPSTVEVSAVDLQFLGSVPWKATDKLLPEQETRLRALSKKTAVAGVLWIYNSARDLDEKSLWREITASIARLAPQNTLALATLSRRASGYFAPYSALLTSARKQFPDNYVLLSADWSWTSKTAGAAASRALAYKEVAAAPENWLTWYELGDSFANKAQEIRNGKYSSEMTASQSSQVSALYPMQTMAGLQAARVNPMADGAWLQACKGAAFDGESEIADIAYWKALALNPNEHDTYWWGLQLYQPKWQGDSTKLHQVAFLMARNPILYAQGMDDICWAFKESDGSDGLVHSMAIDAINLLQAAAKKQPRQVAYHRELCEMLRKKSRLAESVNEYSIWMKLQPDSIIPVINLGNLYSSTLHDKVNAEKMYLAAIKMQPNNGGIMLRLANFYKDTLRDFDKAAPMYRRAMQADPQNDEPLSGLANCYWFMKNDEKTGGALFVRATKMPSNDGFANAEYAWALLQHGQRAQAETEAQKALDLGFTDHPVFKALGMPAK